METNGRFQYTNAIGWRLRLHGFIAKGATEDEVISNWTGLARGYVAGHPAKAEGAA